MFPAITGGAETGPHQGNFVPQDSFQQECDRLSQAVDGVQFERLRWAKTEGPMLAHLVTLAHAAIEARPEFELTEEGATNDLKRFVLKVHSNRIAAIALWLENGHAIANIEALDRSRYDVGHGSPISADFPLVDAAWMAASLQEFFGRIQPSAPAA